MSASDIRWLDGNEVVNSRCPICDDSGAKAKVLDVKNPLPWSEFLHLWRCANCESCFFDPFEFPRYESYQEDRHAIQFYVELGAGIDFMVAPLLRAGIRQHTSLLDIGCGFGFLVSYAKEILDCKAVGVEPSSYGQIGARLLDVAVHTDYIKNVRELAGMKFDTVFSSEVVEHVPNPVTFLEMVSGFLNPDGVCILTTPNAEAVSIDAPYEILMPTLSPGYHYAIFSPEAMDRALRRIGFAYIDMEEQGDRIVVIASRRPFHGRQKNEQADYFRYLDIMKESENPWLISGLHYRKLKTLVNLGQYDRAEKAYEELKVAIQRARGVNVGDTSRTTEIARNAASFEEAGDRLPYNVPGIYYYIAMALLNHRADYGEAERFFDAAFVQAAIHLQRRGAYVVFVEFADLLWRMKFHAGLARLYQGKIAAARADFEQVASAAQESSEQFGHVRANPDLVPQAWYYAGVAAARSGDTAGAKRCFGQVLDLAAAAEPRWRRLAAQGLGEAVAADVSAAVGRYRSKPSELFVIYRSLRKLLSELDVGGPFWFPRWSWQEAKVLAKAAVRVYRREGLGSVVRKARRRLARG